RGDPTPDKADFVPAQHRQIADLLADEVPLDVGAGDDRVHARHLLRLRNIDAADARVRMRAAQDFYPEQTGKLDVGRIDRVTADLIATLAARHRSAENFMFRHSFLSSSV